MSYWDTSALVKLYAKELDSSSFEERLVGLPRPLITSRITLYEARASFRRKESEGILKPAAAQLLYNELLEDIAAAEVRLIDLGPDVEREYGHVLDRCHEQSPPLLLRTLDALHLACARVAGETEVVTTDKRLRDAAKRLGLTLFPV